MYDSPYFSPKEFRCRCGRESCEGSHEKMDSKFLDMLFRLRAQVDMPFNISSAYRCKAHNKSVGGARFSNHVKGRAVDILCSDPTQRFELVEMATNFGFTVIVYSSFIHLDNRNGDPKLMRGDY